MHLHTYESTNGQSMSRIKINSFPIGLLKTNYTRALNVLCCVVRLSVIIILDIYERFCMYRDIVHVHSQSNFIEMWCVEANSCIHLPSSPVSQSINQFNIIIIISYSLLADQTTIHHRCYQFKLTETANKCSISIPLVIKGENIFLYIHSTSF